MRTRKIKMKNLAIYLIFSLNYYLCPSRLIFLAMSKQLYIPGERYSTIYVQHKIGSIETNLLNINIEFSLNQTTPSQSNTIFDVLLSPLPNPYFDSCYDQNYQALNSSFINHNPCQQACNITNDPSVKETLKVLDYNIDFNEANQENQMEIIVDNTFYPCQGGSYMPELYLEESFRISISQNYNYLLALRLVLVFLLQILIIGIAFLAIMLSKFRKLRSESEKSKSQKEAQQLLNSFMSSFQREI